jgi:small membrane protein
MKLIQLILLLALIILLISYFRWFRSAAFDKILIALIFLTGILFVLFPDTTTKISLFLGVGRGADLLVYAAVISFGYIVLLLYSKIKKLESQLAELVRYQAIKGAQNFSTPKKDEDSQ